MIFGNRNSHRINVVTGCLLWRLPQNIGLPHYIVQIWIIWLWKGKRVPVHAMKACEGVEAWFTHSWPPH